LDLRFHDRRKASKEGYGKEALKEIIKHISDLHGSEEIMIGHKPDNIIAARLYETVGFDETGEIINGEIIRRIRLK
jgi:diamine N-acetyltransferase